MSKLKEMRERFHRDLPAEADAIIAKAKAESREPSDEEVTRLETLHAEQSTLKTSIEAEERRARAVLNFATPHAPQDALHTGSPSDVVVGDDNRQKRPWGSNGEFLMAVRAAYTPNSGGADPRLFAAVTGMSQSTPSDGGFTVPPEFSTAIWDGLNSPGNGNLMGMCDEYTVTGESITFNANAETSRATGSRYGGVKGYWINEADQMTKSKPTFRTARVEPQELAVLIYATDKLLENSAIALEQYLTRAATEEINFLVGDAIVNGTGVGQPKGIMASGCTVSVAKETSQTATTFQRANANKMWARMHPRSRANAVWLMNVDVEPQLDEFNEIVKNVAGSENVGGRSTSIYNAEKGLLKGRPIVFVEFCQTLGTVGDVILADMKGYLLGVRGGIKSAMSIHLRFDYNETAFRFKFAADGQSWLASPLTPYKGSNTLSTFVTCATRS